MNSLTLIFPSCTLNFKTKNPPHDVNLLQNLPSGTNILQNLSNGAKTFGGCHTPYTPGKPVYKCSNDTLTVRVYFKAIPDIIFKNTS